jgi:hypothetical protein
MLANGTNVTAASPGKVANVGHHSLGSRVSQRPSESSDDCAPGLCAGVSAPGTGAGRRRSPEQGPRSATAMTTPSSRPSGAAWRSGSSIASAGRPASSWPTRSSSTSGSFTTAGFDTRRSACFHGRVRSSTRDRDGSMNPVRRLYETRGTANRPPNRGTSTRQFVAPS